MHLKMTNGEQWFQALAILFITLVCLAMVYPFIHLLAISFSTPKEALRTGFHLYPKQFSVEAYVQSLRSDGIWTGFVNTLFRTGVGTALSIVFMSLGAYPLSKKYLPHLTFYTMFIVLTMFFSGGLIPTYLLIKGLGLYDSRWVYVIPSLIFTFLLLIMRNFFMSIPAELEESAKLDGANDIRILFSLVIPLSTPIIATVAVYMAVYHWNAWLDGLLYIQDQKKVVLQIFLRRLVVENSDSSIQMLMNEQTVNPETLKAAVLMISTIPILTVYPFLQKYFVKGIMLGSLKG